MKFIFILSMRSFINYTELSTDFFKVTNDFSNNFVFVVKN